MKYLLMLIMFFAFVANNYADDAKYIKRMKQYIKKMETLKTSEEWQDHANSFERIAKAEKDKWQPWYYVSYCRLMSSFSETDNTKKDKILEKAMEEAEKAAKIDENAEVLTLKAFILQMQIVINPMARGQSYGMKSSSLLDKAIEIDAGNPRPYFMKGSSLFYTPAMYGGGKENAKPWLAKAAEKYDSFKPATEIDPDWGKEENQKLLDQCNTEK